MSFDRFVEKYQRDVVKYAIENLPDQFEGSFEQIVTFKKFYDSKQTRVVYFGDDMNSEIDSLTRACKGMLRAVREDDPIYMNPDNIDIGRGAKGLLDLINIHTMVSRVEVPANAMCIILRTTNQDAKKTELIYAFAEIRKADRDAELPKSRIRKLLLDKFLSTFKWKVLTMKEYRRVFKNSRRFLVPKRIVDMMEYPEYPEYNVTCTFTAGDIPAFKNAINLTKEIYEKYRCTDIVEHGLGNNEGFTTPVAPANPGPVNYGCPYGPGFNKQINDWNGYIKETPVESEDDSEISEREDGDI